MVFRAAYDVQKHVKKGLGQYLDVSPSHNYSVSQGCAVDEYTCLDHMNRYMIFVL